MIRPNRFEITDERDGSRLRLAIAGELDLATVPALTERVEETLDAGLTEVTLDLRKLDFIDSTGVRAVIELDARSRGADWRLTLLRPENDAAMIVFRITGMETALPFEPSGTS